MSNMKEIVSTIMNINLMAEQLTEQCRLSGTTLDELQEVESRLLDLTTPLPCVIGYCANCLSDLTVNPHADCCQNTKLVRTVK